MEIRDNRVKVLGKLVMVRMPFCLLHLLGIEAWTVEDVFIEIEKLSMFPRIGSVESIITIAFATQVSFEFWVAVRF